MSPVSLGRILGEYAERKVVLSKIEDPLLFNCFWVEEEDLADWRVRLFEVEVPENYEVLVQMAAHHDAGPDQAAEISSDAGQVAADISKMKPAEIWYGDSIARQATLDPVLYLQARMNIMSNLNRYGIQLPIVTNGSSSTEEKVIAGGFLRGFMTHLVEHVVNENRAQTVNFYHYCIAYYNILVESEIILPRQVMPNVFDAAYKTCHNLSGDWEVDMDNILNILDGPTSYDSSEEWGAEDIVHAYDSETSYTVADLQGLPDRFPDGVFKSYIVVINNPELAKVMMPLEDLAEFMEENGAPFPHDNLDKSLAYTYSTIVSWRNSAFRRWVSLEPNEAKGIAASLFEDDNEIMGGLDGVEA